LLTDVDDFRGNGDLDRWLSVGVLRFAAMDTSFAHGLLREVTDGQRHCQLTTSVAPDGRWEFSLLSSDPDGQVMTDLSGYIAPDDVALVLRTLPLELATMGSWLQPFTAVEVIPPAVAERRKRYPNHLAKWTEEDDIRLVDLHRSGSSLPDLGKEFGRSVGAVTARLVKLGELPPEQARWIVRPPA
jgi:hypothetical protein